MSIRQQRLRTNRPIPPTVVTIPCKRTTLRSILFTHPRILHTINDLFSVLLVSTCFHEILGPSHLLHRISPMDTHIFPLALGFFRKLGYS